MDHLDAPAPVDGQYRRVLSVRDLATGQHLLALPVVEATARSTADALRALFREHGPPLVIKSDNGSALTAGEVPGVLREANVVHLRSPPGLPQYNGSCEAGVGALKTRAHHAAARYDRPGEWTCDDVESARLQANELGRPKGLRGPTPARAWAARAPLDVEERRRLEAELAKQTLAERETRGYKRDAVPSGEEEASLLRIAISRALVALDILRFRRRHIRLAIPAALRAGIT